MHDESKYCNGTHMLCERRQVMDSERRVRCHLASEAILLALLEIEGGRQ